MAPARVHAELTLGMGVHVSEPLVAVLMSMNRIAGPARGWESQTLAWCSQRRSFG